MCDRAIGLEAGLGAKAVHLQSESKRRFYLGSRPGHASASSYGVRDVPGLPVKDKTMTCPSAHHRKLFF